MSGTLFTFFHLLFSGHEPCSERDVHWGWRPLDPLQVWQGAQGLQDVATGFLPNLNTTLLFCLLSLCDEILSSGTGNSFCTWLNQKNGQQRQCTRWKISVEARFIDPLMWWLYRLEFLMVLKCFKTGLTRIQVLARLTYSDQTHLYIVSTIRRRESSHQIWKRRWLRDSSTSFCCPGATF